MLAARAATLIFALLALLALGYGSASVIQIWFRGPVGEEGGWVFVLYWPLAWLVSGLCATAALLTSRRIGAGLLPLGLLWGLDIIVWWLVLPNLDRLDRSGVSAVISILVFDVSVIFFVWRFLAHGSSTTILGR